MYGTDPQQTEFLLSDGPAPELITPAPLADLVAEMARLWGLPLYQKARLTLKNHALDEVRGRLELVKAPDLPLNQEQLLLLRASGVEFTHRQITEWTLLDE